VPTGAVVRALTRWPYDGEMVTIQTAGGRHLTATPHHPVLTTKGWVQAAALRQGDDLVCDLRYQQACPTGDHDVAGREASLAEMFSAAQMMGQVESYSGHEGDFHGDGVDGQVDVVWPNGELLVGDLALLTQPSMKHLFPESDLASSSFCSCCGFLIGYQQLCLRCGTPWDSVEPSTNGWLGDAEGGGQRADALPRLVSVGNVLGINVKEPGVGVLHSSEFVSGGEAPGASVPLDPSGNSSWADANVAPDLATAFPGDVATDRIVSCVTREWSGHVYNLSTANGYYTVDGIYTSNTFPMFYVATEKYGPVGIDSADEAATIGLLTKVIQLSGSWYTVTFTGERVQGREALVEALRAQPDTVAKIRELALALKDATIISDEGVDVDESVPESHEEPS
jgi:hypothetical protein